MVEAWNEDRRDDYDALLSTAWHAAVLERSKQIPPLNKLLGRTDQPVREDPRVLAERLKAALMCVRPTGRGEPPKPNGAAKPDEAAPAATTDATTAAAE